MLQRVGAGVRIPGGSDFLSLFRHSNKKKRNQLLRASIMEAHYRSSQNKPQNLPLWSVCLMDYCVNRQRLSVQKLRLTVRLPFPPILRLYYFSEIRWEASPPFWPCTFGATVIVCSVGRRVRLKSSRDRKMQKARCNLSTKRQS